MPSAKVWQNQDLVRAMTIANGYREILRTTVVSSLVLICIQLGEVSANRDSLAEINDSCPETLQSIAIQTDLDAVGRVLANMGTSTRDDSPAVDLTPMGKSQVPMCNLKTQAFAEVLERVSHAAGNVTDHLAFQLSWDSEGYPQRDTQDPSIRYPATKGSQYVPVTLIEFADFQCPFCARVSSVRQQLLSLYPGQIQFHFKHLPLPFHPDAALAHETVMAAGEQGKFWEMHDLLFANQKRMKKDDLLRYATQIGLDLEKFRRALDTHQYRHVVEQDLAEAQRLGVTGTPTFFINERKLVGARSLAEFRRIIDQELGLIPRTEDTRDQTPPASTISIRELNLSGSPSRGLSDAPITIVEYSDYQCPFCARAVPTLKQILEAYPKEVRWVFKNYPLDFHPDASLAHAAAWAAGEQGKYWEMHDLLFAHQKDLKRDHLLKYAKQLGLDVERFVSSLDRGPHRALVERDTSEGQRLGISGTPTFFINGKRLVGAQPLTAFKALIDAELGRPESKVSPQVEAVKAPDPRAPVTLTIFADFQSPMSAQAARLGKVIARQHGDRVRLVFKHFPLQFHHEARLAHEAALASGEQGKFWEMHDLLFQHQSDFRRERLQEDAKLLGLDLSLFSQALDDHRFQPAVRQDIQEGKSRNVRGVPTLFVNATRLDGVPDLTLLQGVIDQELAHLSGERGMNGQR